MINNIYQIKKEKDNESKKRLMDDIENIEDIKDYILITRGNNQQYSICHKGSELSLYELKGVLEYYLTQNQLDGIEINIVE